jgi:hypothetical protein
MAGLGAVLIGLWALYEKLIHGHTVQGWTTIMVLVAAASSAQLLMTGVLGEYVGRIYEEVKRRPLYTVQEEYNIEVRSPAVEAPPMSKTHNERPVPFDP